jgi:hypothetical protein
MLGPELGPGGPPANRASRSKGVGPDVPPGPCILLMSMLPNMLANGSEAAVCSKYPSESDGKIISWRRA